MVTSELTCHFYYVFNDFRGHNNSSSISYNDEFKKTQIPFFDDEANKQEGK